MTAVSLMVIAKQMVEMEEAMNRPKMLLSNPTRRPGLLVIGASMVGLLLCGCPPGAEEIPSWIVFASTRAAGGGDYDIWGMRTSGTSLARYTDDAQSDTEPTLSPDGLKIVFVRDNNIWIMDFGGGNAQQLTSWLPSEIYYGRAIGPTFTPDGSRIVYADSTLGDLMIMDVDGSNVTILEGALGSPSTPAHAPSVSPDGTKIAYSLANATASGSDIYIVDIDGSNPRAVTASNSDTDDSDGVWNIQPAWSPDGARIAYSSYPYRGEFGAHIWIVDRPESPLASHTQLTTGSGHETQPAFSPNGTWMAYVYQAFMESGSDIWIMKTDGSDQMSVLNDVHGDSHPSFSGSP